MTEKPCDMDVLDDPSLLKEMLADQQQAPEMYQPTNYWSVYAKRFLPEIEHFGLHNFRSRHDSVLDCFGAADLMPAIMPDNVFLKWLPKSAQTAIRQRVGRSSPYQDRRKRSFAAFFEEADTIGRKWGAKPLSDFNGSLLGCPEDYYEIGSRNYTYLSVDYYLQYAWCCQYLNFDTLSTFVELGSGAGKLIELLKYFYPHITFYLFDIAPQLYVCEQFLKGVFPESVVSYRDAKQIRKLGEDNHRGKIVMMGAYQFPLLADCSIDIFWNSASFQEMEPKVVENYLHYVDKACRHIYLRQMLCGHGKARSSGEHGVMESTTFKHYINALKGHKLVDARPSFDLWSRGALQGGYVDSFWTAGQEFEGIRKSNSLEISS